MNCPSCGGVAPALARFCPECGTAFSRRCGSCGAEVTAAAKFCAECGTATGTAPAASRAAADRSPRDYTPKHLADRILQSKSTLEGERKQVTFPFADAKGSVELAEDLDPEQWHRILARFFAMLT